MNGNELWSRNNPLFMYGNEDKLDDLLGRAFGEVVTGLERASQSEISGTINVAAKFGGFLQALGLADAEISSEVNAGRTNIKNEISKKSFENKLNALYAYAANLDYFPYIDSYTGQSLQRTPSVPVREWQGEPIGEEHAFDTIGHILGIFSAKRLSPPHDDKADISAEYFASINNFWLFSSVADSKIEVDLPVFIGKTRTNSQHAAMAFLHSKNRYKIECLGLLSWENRKVVCDPIAWRLFY